MTLTTLALLWLLLSLACTLLGAILTIRRAAHRMPFPTMQLVCGRCGATREARACCGRACGQRLQSAASGLCVPLAQEGGR